VAWLQTKEFRTIAGRLGLLAALVCLAASPAAATSTYAITGGEIILTASAGGSFLSDPVSIPADGETLRLDLTPGSEEIVSISLTGSGPQSVALTPPIGGYDTLRVDSVALGGGPGTLTEIGPVPPDVEFFALVEDLVLDVSFALEGAALPDDPGDVMIPLGTGTAQLFVSLSGDDVTFTGFAIADYSHPDFATPITVKVDFDVTAVLIPEPSGAIVFALGLLPVARAVRRGGSRRS
jgi:hypothetical protein